MGLRIMDPAYGRGTSVGAREQRTVSGMSPTAVELEALHQCGVLLGLHAIR
jgi:hypothetical protein